MASALFSRWLSFVVVGSVERMIEMKTTGLVIVCVTLAMSVVIGSAFVYAGAEKNGPALDAYQLMDGPVSVKVRGDDGSEGILTLNKGTVIYTKAIKEDKSKDGDNKKVGGVL